jgi:hypothetical protein
MSCYVLSSPDSAFREDSGLLVSNEVITSELPVTRPEHHLAVVLPRKLSEPTIAWCSATSFSVGCSLKGKGVP